LATKKLCLTDWDGTLRRGYTAVDWLSYLTTTGLVCAQHLEDFHVALEQYDRGQLPYEELVRTGAQLYGNAIRGLHAGDLEAYTPEFLSSFEEALFPFSAAILDAFADEGIEVAVITGAPEEPLRAYLSRYPRCHLFAVQVEQNENGVYTGDVKQNYGLEQKKREAVISLLSQPSEVIIALGNSESDWPLFEPATLRLFVSNGKEVARHPNLRILRTDDGASKVLRTLEHFGGVRWR